MLIRWRTSPVLPSCAVAAVLAVSALALGFRGGDWPAQLHRVNLFRQAGFTQWDNYWYGGHHSPGYSLLYPPLAVVFGITLTAVLSAVVATWCFAIMAKRWLPAPRAAAILFGAGTMTNVAIGRLTFALGLAVGMAAVLAMTSGRRALALGLATLTVCASPVAGAFLMLVGLAWAVTARPVRRLGIGVLATALVTLAVVGIAFPEGGTFPFSLDDLAITAGVGVLAAVLLPSRYQPLRVGGLLYAVAAVVTAAVPNAMGANIMRLGMYLGAPVVIGVMWPDRRRFALALAVPLLAWQWWPAADGIFTARLDPSGSPAYYDGLVAQLDALHPTRIEIPFTSHHWETTYVASHTALARGWERQLDIGANPLFYDGTLSPTSYLQWLADNAVEYVAVPDVPLDDAAVAEGALVRRGVPGLQLVWHDAHWQLWKVTSTKPVVEGPAELVAFDTDSFTLRVDQPGDVLVRIHYSSHWDTDGTACFTQTDEDWTRIRFAAAGTWRVRQVLSRWNPFESDATAADCPA